MELTTPCEPPHMSVLSTNNKMYQKPYDLQHLVPWLLVCGNDFEEAYTLDTQDG
jgi:hypothetical protein